MIDKKVYYSYDKIDSLNAAFNFIVSVRGNGKTYGAKKKCIKKFLKNGRQFIYLRRTKTELKAVSTFFNDIAHEWPDVEFRVNGHEAQCKFSENGKWQTMGYFLSLSVAQTTKSVSFSDVDTIIFDEFIVEKGYARYLPNEFEVFVNFYNTVDRYNDRVKVYFLANAVRITNPYFLQLDVKPDKELARYSNGFVAVHLCEAKDFNREVSKTRFAQFLRDVTPEYAQYAMDNHFSDAEGLMVGKKPPSFSPKWSLEIRGVVLYFWSSPSGRDWYVTQKETKGLPSFVTDPARCTGENILMLWNDRLMQMLRSSYNCGAMAFSDVHTRNVFVNVFRRW